MSTPSSNVFPRPSASILDADRQPEFAVVIARHVLSDAERQRILSLDAEAPTRVVSRFSLYVQQFVFATRLNELRAAASLHSVVCSRFVNIAIDRFCEIFFVFNDLSVSRTVNEMSRQLGNATSLMRNDGILYVQGPLPLMPLSTSTSYAPAAILNEISRVTALPAPSSLFTSQNSNNPPSQSLAQNIPRRARPSNSTAPAPSSILSSGFVYPPIPPAHTPARPQASIQVPVRSGTQLNAPSRPGTQKNAQSVSQSPPQTARKRTGGASPPSTSRGAGNSNRNPLVADMATGSLTVGVSSATAATPQRQTASQNPSGPPIRSLASTYSGSRPTQVASSASMQSNARPSTNASESRADFAVIHAKNLISWQQVRMFTEDRHEQHRFWTYMAQFARNFYEDFRGTESLVSELDIQSRLVQVNNKSYREIFFVRARGPQRRTVEELKQLLLAASIDMRLMGKLLLANAETIPKRGGFYVASATILNDIRHVPAVAIAPHLLPSNDEPSSSTAAPSNNIPLHVSSRPQASRQPPPSQSRQSGPSMVQQPQRTKPPAEIIELSDDSDSDDDVVVLSGPLPGALHQSLRPPIQTRPSPREEPAATQIPTRSNLRPPVQPRNSLPSQPTGRTEEVVTLSSSELTSSRPFPPPTDQARLPLQNESTSASAQTLTRSATRPRMEPWTSMQNESSAQAPVPATSAGSRTMLGGGGTLQPASVDNGEDEEVISVPPPDPASTPAKARPNPGPPAQTRGSLQHEPIDIDALEPEIIDLTDSPLRETAALFEELPLSAGDISTAVESDSNEATRPPPTPVRNNAPPSPLTAAQDELMPPPPPLTMTQLAAPSPPSSRVSDEEPPPSSPEQDAMEVDRASGVVRFGLEGTPALAPSDPLRLWEEIASPIRRTGSPIRAQNKVLISSNLHLNAIQNDNSPPTIDRRGSDSTGYPSDVDMLNSSANGSLRSDPGVLDTIETQGSKFRPKTPLSEASSDIEGVREEVDSINVEDLGTNCTEWARTLAKDMEPKMAINYLRKAAQYHRDPLDSSFGDRMRAQPEEYKKAGYNRSVFESWMVQSTMDEPEAPPIDIRNDVDGDPCPPWDFVYTNSLIRGDGVPKPPKLPDLEGCNCVGGCRSDRTVCACAERNAADPGTRGFRYDDHGRVQDLQNYPIFECNEACSCAEYCNNRVAQNGRKCTLEIRKTQKTGWGVFAGEDIPKGMFLGVYSGELLIDEEASVRGILYNDYNRNYLFDVDFHYVKQLRKRKGSRFRRDRFCVDAMHAGCFTRFFNHSCDPNAVIIPCVFGEAWPEIPYLAFFTLDPVPKGEEITFSYRGETMVDENERRAARLRADAKRRLAKQKTTKKGATGVFGKIDVQCQCGSLLCEGSMWNFHSDSEEDEELDGSEASD